MILTCSLIAVLAAVLSIAVIGAVRTARGHARSADTAAEDERRAKAQTSTEGEAAAQRPQCVPVPVADEFLTKAEWAEWVGIRHASNMAETPGETP